METNYLKRTSGQILEAVSQFCLYHDLLHEQAQRGNIKSSLDRGAFVRPQDVLSQDILDLLGKHSRSNSYAYGPERGDYQLREKIAELENARHGTTYTAENVAMMPGAWAGLEFVLQEVVDLRNCVKSDGEIAIVGPTLYQMFHNPIFYLGMNMVAYDFVVSGKSHVPSKEDIDDILDNNPKAIVISNSNNPDGKYIPNGVLKHTIERAQQQDTYVIVDEIQNCFPATGDITYESWIQRPHVIRVDSPSKRYALPEYRVGWVLAESDLLGDRMDGIVGRMSGIMGNAPRAANTALIMIIEKELEKIQTGENFLDKPEQELYKKERYVVERLQSMPRVNQIFPRDACINLAFQVDYSGTDMDLARELMQEGTLIMPACGYGYDPAETVMRITFAERDNKLEHAMDCLNNILTK